MKFGVIVTDDDKHRGGEVGTGEYFIERFTHRNVHKDEFTPIYAITGELPKDNEIITYDGFIITGSHYSVNEGAPWMLRLEAFIRKAYYMSLEFGKPRMFGMCFGHQLIAKALGGRVDYNDNKTFYFGSVDVEVDEVFVQEEFVQEHFGKGRKPSLKMMKLHGECVVEVPKSARVIGSSSHCKHEILMYGNSILTSQGHPEYTKKEMYVTNATVVESSGHVDALSIRMQLLALEDDDVDNLTEMVRSFLRHNNRAQKAFMANSMKSKRKFLPRQQTIAT